MSKFYTRTISLDELNVDTQNEIENDLYKTVSKSLSDMDRTIKVDELMDSGFNCQLEISLGDGLSTKETAVKLLEEISNGWGHKLEEMNLNKDTTVLDSLNKVIGLLEQ